MTGIWLTLLVVALCLLLSAVLSASEAALTAASRAGLAWMEKQGNRRAGIAMRLLVARERVTGALLVGRIVANVAAVALASGLMLACFGDVGAVYAAIVMSVVVIVFAELLPRAVARAAPEHTASRMARPARIAVRVFAPLLAGGEALARLLLRTRGSGAGEDQPAAAAQEDGRGAYDPPHRDGGADRPDRDMMAGLLDLRDLTVSDVMVHRTEMVTVDADQPAGEVVAAVLASGFTRVPLWRGSPENIVGILHTKHLLRAIRNANGDLAKIDASALVLPPWFVPDIRPLSEQLKAFRRRKTHFALVVDEYGEVEGLVTLEDVLEAVVGDISDEHDVPVPGVQPQPDGSVSVEGSVPIRDLNRAMDWSLPDEEATTIAGLVIHEARSIPEVGQSFTFHGFRFRVLRKERNRIAALRITPLVRKPALPAPARPA